MAQTFNNPIVYELRPSLVQNTLYLDRDGVLTQIVMRGEEISSPRSLEELRFSDDIEALAAEEITNNWNLVIISNQPDLSRGRIDLKLLDHIKDELNVRLSVNAIYICPHQSHHLCDCRKPKHGLIKKYRQDNPGLKGQELFIGDRPADQQCAANAQIPFILRRRQYNSDLLNKSKYVINSLYEIDPILRKEMNNGL
jgi:D-glycero-D-manno-heptose 1,7-bisphosphate phosphatase